MYRLYYQLNDSPFGSEPDPKYFYPSQPHKAAIKQLRSGLEKPNGILVLSGEKGLGKSTLASLFTEQLDKDQNIIGTITQPPLTVRELLPAILTALNIRITESEPKAQVNILRKLVLERTKQNKKVFLIIDDAQTLTHDCLEFLRLVSALFRDEKNLFQILLLGLPELNNTLSSEDNQALQQMVCVSTSLQPLNAADTRAYVERRLRVAGWNQKPVIDDEAFAAIHHKTGGVPSKINRYCDRLLMLGMLLETNNINAEVVASLTKNAIEKLDQMEANRHAQQEKPAPIKAETKKAQPQFEEPRKSAPVREFDKGFEIKSDFFDKPARSSKPFLSKQLLGAVAAVCLAVPLGIYVFENMIEKESNHQQTAKKEAHSAKPTHVVAEAPKHKTNDHGTNNHGTNSHNTGHAQPSHESGMETETYVLNEISNHSGNEHSVVASSGTELLDINSLLNLSGGRSQSLIGNEVSITTTESAAEHGSH